MHSKKVRYLFTPIKFLKIFIELHCSLNMHRSCKFTDSCLVLYDWMDGQMTCDFTSFSTVFQSYQDDGWMIMKLKAVCNGTPFTVEQISPQAGIELSLLDQ